MSAYVFVHTIQLQYSLIADPEKLRIHKHVLSIQLPKSDIMVHIHVLNRLMALLAINPPHVQATYICIY